MTLSELDIFEMVCTGCRNGEGFDLPISMAFQPIVDVTSMSVFAHEALVRGEANEPAGSILEQVDQNNRYAFDQKCRVTAIRQASEYGLANGDSLLSINFLPNAVYEPRACIRLTLETAVTHSFPTHKILFEFTETERLDTQHILNILRSYHAMGFKTAIDDFGAGFAGIAVLNRFQPDFVKLDMEMIRDCDSNRTKKLVLKYTLAMLRDLGIQPICEGIETIAEFEVLREFDVDLMQGYLFARPLFQGLAEPVFPDQAPDSLLVAAG